PLATCNGNSKVEFLRQDGGEINAAFVIIRDEYLPGLLFNGQDYSLVASATPVFGASGYSTILFENENIDFYNVLEAEGNFQTGLVTGITSTSGGFCFVPGFMEKIDIFDPRTDLPS